jgi:hypothetical protein
MEITAMERDQQIAAYRARAEEVDRGIGVQPFAEVPVPFLTEAQAFQAQVLPGWTPTTTFYDDFTIVPGGVGSSWTVTTVGNGAVSQPSANVARFDSPGPSGSARAHVATVSVPDPSVGRFFCACRAKISAALPSGAARAGAGTSLGASTAVAGINAFGAQYYSVAANVAVPTTYELDSTKYVTLRVWWNTGSAVFGCVDDSPFVSTRSSVAAGRLPFIIAQNTTARIDVTDYVAMV